MNGLLCYSLRYDAWANECLAEVLMETDAAEGLQQVHAWMSHILLAGSIWAERAEGQALTLNAWAMLEPQSYKATIRQNLQRWENLLETAGSNCDRSVVYQNLQGKRFETPLYRIITHLTHHGAYHRGQIATAMKSSGINPPPTDAILYARML